MTYKVVLDVGGTLYPTTIETLLRSEYLTNLAEGQSGEKPVFIDRDGPLFRYVLYYLRTGHVFDLDIPNLECLELEARYYGLSAMTRKVEIMLNDLKSSTNNGR